MLSARNVIVHSQRCTGPLPSTRTLGLVLATVVTALVLIEGIAAAAAAAAGGSDDAAVRRKDGSSSTNGSQAAAQQHLQEGYAYNGLHFGARARHPGRRSYVRASDLDVVSCWLPGRLKLRVERDEEKEDNGNNSGDFDNGDSNPHHDDHGSDDGKDTGNGDAGSDGAEGSNGSNGEVEGEGQQRPEPEPEYEEVSVMHHIMISLCNVPRTSGSSGSNSGGGSGGGDHSNTLRVRGVLCTTREVQPDWCDTCHSHCLDNPFGERALSEQLLWLRSPATGRAQPLSLSDEGEGYWQSGTPEDGGGMYGEVHMDPHDRAWQGYELFIDGSPYYCMVTVPAATHRVCEANEGPVPGGRQRRQQLHLQSTRKGQQEERQEGLLLQKATLGAMPFQGLPAAVPGQALSPHHLRGHTGGSSGGGLDSGSITSVRALMSSKPGRTSRRLLAPGSAGGGSPTATDTATDSLQQQQQQQVPIGAAPPRCYFVVAPRHSLSLTGLMQLLLSHMRWHAELGILRYIVYFDDHSIVPFSELPEIQALVSERRLALILWDLTPQFSGELPVKEVLHGNRKDRLRRVVWHQMSTYDHALLLHWHEHRSFMAFADLDEYLLTPKPTSVAQLFEADCLPPLADDADHDDNGSKTGRQRLGALRIPRMDGACSSCYEDREGGGSGSVKKSGGGSGKRGDGNGDGDNGGSGANTEARMWAALDVLAKGRPHPLTLYDGWGKSDLPDMWDQKSIVRTSAVGFTSVHSPYVYPGYDTFGPVHETSDIINPAKTCAVWLHITNMAKIRIERLPTLFDLPERYRWPLRRIPQQAWPSGRVVQQQQLSGQQQPQQ